MIKYIDFIETSSIQASLFVSTLVFSSSKFLRTILDLCSDKFDGNPVVLPIPEDAPREIPRIILERKDKSLKLEISPVRFNLFRYKTKDEHKVLINEFLKTDVELLNNINKKIGSDCVRLAVVLERYCPRKEPAKDIATHFCKKNYIKAPFDRPSSFELHSFKKYELIKSFDVNSWVRIKSGRVQFEKGVSRPIIIAHQDINTSPEPMDKRVYKDADISKFFNNVANELDEILKLYFPET